MVEQTFCYFYLCLKHNFPIFQILSWQGQMWANARVMANANARENLAQNVKFLRHLLGMSQEDLAGRVAVSVPTISAVERGVRNVNLDTLISLADALGVPVESLFATPSAARSIEMVRSSRAGNSDTDT